jgi:RepB DNA-primase from phage plasmid
VKEHAEALAMIDTFASVGAARCDVTLTTRAGDKDWLRRGMLLTDLRRALPDMLDTAAKRECNVIVRPHGPGRTFVQLDDLKAEKLRPLAPAVFLALETSPGNFNGRAYVELTVRNAALAVEHRGRQPTRGTIAGNDRR